MKLKLSLLTIITVFLVGCGTKQPQSLTFKETVGISQDLAVNWLTENIRDKGLFYYLFDPKKGEYSTNNNAIRQLMASRLLAELASEKQSLLDEHTKNLSFIMDHWYQEEGDRAYILYNHKSKLGANAMALRTLVYSPFFDDYTDEAKKLAQGIVHLMKPDGSFAAWYVEPDYVYDEAYLLTFYSGEAILSLVEYVEKTGDETIRAAAEKAQLFYIDHYVKHIDENYYPAYVPWHTLALNHWYKLTEEVKYADALFVLNDKLLEIQDTTEHVGRFYKDEFKHFGNPHSASDGVYTEGLAYAYEIANMVGDSERAERYKHAIELGVQNLISLQYKGGEPELKGHKSWRLRGAFRIKAGDGRVRIDNTQHTIDAFRKILEVF